MAVVAYAGGESPLLKAEALVKDDGLVGLAVAVEDADIVEAALLFFGELREALAARELLEILLLLVVALVHDHDPAGGLSIRRDPEIVSPGDAHVVDGITQIVGSLLCGHSEVMALLSDQLALHQDHVRIVLKGQVVHDLDVRGIARGDGANVGETVFPGAVQGGAADGPDGIEAFEDQVRHGTVEGTLSLEPVGVDVVGAHGDGVLEDPRLHRLEQIPGLLPTVDPQVYVHAHAPLGVELVEALALVVADGASADVGAEPVPGKGRGVALDEAAPLVALRDDIVHALVVVGHSVVVHDLAYAHDPLFVEKVRDLLSAEDSPRFLQPRQGRDARGSQLKEPDRLILSAFQHVFNAPDSQDVGDLVGIGDHGGGAPDADRFSEVLRDHQAGLHVKMGVHEARHQVPAPRVDDGG